MLNDKSYVENGIKEILFNYAKELSLYADYLTNEKNLTRKDLYDVLQVLKIYYNKLSMTLKKGVFAITPSDIDSINNPKDLEYLGENFYIKGHNEIAYYQSFLAEKGLICKPNILYKDPIFHEKKSSFTSYYQRPRHFKVIKSLDKITYYYPYNELPYGKRTVDGRITISKKKLDKYSEFTYIIYDHTKNEYIKDQNGNDLEIKAFNDAKQFVKELYKANWNEWKKAPLPDEKPRE